MAKWADAYDKNTGRKLPNKVPEAWFSLFKNLRKTPIQKKADTAASKKEG